MTYGIATRIEGRMKDLDVSVTRLAEQSGIPRQTLSRRLIDPSTFTIGELERVAGALGVTPETLMFEDAA